MESHKINKQRFIHQNFLHFIFTFQISVCKEKAREIHFLNLDPMARGFRNFILNLTELLNASFSICMVCLLFPPATATLPGKTESNFIDSLMSIILLVYKYQNNIEKS